MRGRRLEDGACFLMRVEWKNPMNMVDYMLKTGTLEVVGFFKLLYDQVRHCMATAFLSSPFLYT